MSDQQIAPIAEITPNSPVPKEIIAMTLRQKLGDTFFIGMLSLLGYGAAFAFEAGYLYHYDVPNWIVEVNLTRFFLTAASIVTSMGMILGLLQMIPANLEPIWVLLNRFFPGVALSFLGTYILITNHTNNGIIWGTIITLLGIVSFYIIVIAPIRKNRSYDKWLDRWRADILRDRENQLFTDVLDRLISNTTALGIEPQIVWRGILWGWIFFIGVFWFGWYKAHTANTFFF